MKELTVQAMIENIPVVIAFIDVELEALNCPVKTQMQIDVAIDELLSNIAHYAYPDGKGEVTVRFDYEEAMCTVSITLIDSGIPFDPLQKGDPDVTLSVEEREVGGLGIFMVKKTMDSMAYKHEEGFNILTIQKQMECANSGAK